MQELGASAAREASRLWAGTGHSANEASFQDPPWFRPLHGAGVESCYGWSADHILSPGRLLACWIQDTS